MPRIYATNAVELACNLPVQRITLMAQVELVKLMYASFCIGQLWLLVSNWHA